MEIIIITILLLYLAILIFIGLYSSKKVKSSKGFFLADRKIGTFTLTATITATVVGGSATVATASLIYRSGLPGLWLDIGAAAGLIILGITLAKKVRETGLFTLPEITGKLFDEKVRYASSILIIITQIAWVSLLIQAAKAVLIVLLPAESDFLLVLITIIFILYTLIGGQFAVVYTDIIQFLVMIVGVCFIATPILYFKAAPLINEIPANLISFPINTNYGFLPILSLFFLMIMPHVVGPDIYSKILSAKNAKTASKAAVLSGIFRTIFAISIGLIAISAIALIPNLPVNEAALAMPRAISLLHPLLAGVILAAFVSVMLSSADSVLLSSGTILSVDITRKKNIITSRIGILIVGILALLLALYLDNILNTLTLAYTVFSAGLTLPIIFGFYKEKTHVSSKGALISLIFGGGISLICLQFTSYAQYAVLIGLLVSLIPLLIFREKKYRN